MANHNLELYTITNCPYCLKVLNYMKQAGIEMPIHDAKANLADRETLVRVGGKYQAPCLFIDGVAMYESDDIIAWLKENVA